MEEGEAEIDPRIKQELECLNTTSKKINDLENDINEKRSQYRSALTSSTQRLNLIARKLGDCVSKARPYYEAKRIAKNAHNEAQQAALQFERAVSMHTAAREMVTVAERGMVKDSQDTAWAEMLNHATTKVNEAESERYRSETEHQKRAEAFKTAEEEVKKLQKNLKSSIKKSQPYFEMKKVTQQTLETIKSSVDKVDTELKLLKQLYSTTLHTLEKISDTIHASRDIVKLAEEQESLLLGKRQEGVGAESPFNSQEIMSSLKLASSDSQLNILGDLKEFDSVDHLSSLASSLNNLDSISCASSLSSTASRPVASEDLKSGDDIKEAFQPVVSDEKNQECQFSKDVCNDVAPKEGIDALPNDLLALTEVVDVTEHLSSEQHGVNNKNISSNSSQNINNVPMPSSATSSANLVAQVSPSEILLSVAGLGKVSANATD